MNPTARFAAFRTWPALLHAFWRGFLLLALAGPLLIYGRQIFQRPPRTSESRILFQGIEYFREARSWPRPLMLHRVKIDLTHPGIRAKVTGSLPQGSKNQSGLPVETIALTPSEFLRQQQLQVVVNANYFYPFREETPWDFYPHSGDWTNVVGQAIADGQAYSAAEPDWPVLCFSATHRASMHRSGDCPAGTLQGVAGSALLLVAGQPQPIAQHLSDAAGLHSRTAVGLDAAGQTLWLLVIDDKQPFYSEGVTFAELQQIGLELGLDSLINLDGGGSTTLVISTPQGFQILNSPIQTKIPMRQRPVANHLGFYAHP